MKIASTSPLKMAFSPPVIRQSLIVAFVVGTVLCLINQGDKMIMQGEVDMLKLVMTYIVPFLVSTYGAWNMARISQR